MKLTDVLKSDEINQLILKSVLHKSTLVELYDQSVLRVFNSEEELFDWYLEDGQDCEYFLDQPLDSFLDKIKLYANNSRTVLDALRQVVIRESEYIYLIGDNKKLVMIN